MKVKVKMYPQAMKQLSRAQIQAAEMTAQQMISEVRNDGLIPFDTGNMQNESTFVDSSKAKQGVVVIVTDTPYAERLYFHPEYQFNTSKNANAGGEWWEHYISGAKAARPVELYAKFYKRVSGGYVK